MLEQKLGYSEQNSNHAFEKYFFKRTKRVRTFLLPLRWLKQRNKQMLVKIHQELRITRNKIISNLVNESTHKNTEKSKVKSRANKPIVFACPPHRQNRAGYLWMCAHKIRDVRMQPLFWHLGCQTIK